MKKFLFIVFVAMSAFIIFTACGGGDSSDDGSTDGDNVSDGDDSAEPVCEAGKVIECPCAGGGQGVQTCAEDGSKWGECAGCSAVDGDEGDGDVADGDAPDGDMTDGDASDGDVSDGDLSDGDTVDGDVTDGDAEEVEAEAEAEVEIEAETELSGRCSASGEPCSEDVPCAASSYEVHGFCSASAGSSYYTCLYPPRRESAEEYPCGDVTLQHCESNFDCPYSIGCGGLGAGWCASGSEAVEKVCLSGATLNLGLTPCEEDIQCTQTLSNICVICGNLNIDSNQEECDDGNKGSGDGCSETCQNEGTCYDGESEIAFSSCSKDEDCLSEMDCEYGDCTCVY